MDEMNKIKQLRERTGLSQRKFAEKFHITIVTLRQWEQGRRQPSPCIEYMIERILDLEELQSRNRGD